MNQKRKFSPIFYNWVTYFGVWLAFFAFLTEAFLFIIDYYAHGSNLYLGLFTYLLLPPFLIVGLLLIPLGALRKRRRVRQGKTELEPKPLVINPSIPAHRNTIFVFMTGTFILIVMSMVGAYKSFHYTESVKFCGVLCHKIMSPEHTAYLHSPHAKVKCVECHIGAGADSYLHSKVSGARQVVKALTNTYKTPIHTPVKDLRPSKETCEQCHWPQKFFGTLDFNRDYFLTEGEEPHWKLRMRLNTGGGERQSYGVHSHMNTDRDVYYVADESRQKIEWIRSVEKDGKETIFVSPGSQYEKAAPPADKIRRMDCIDCHNRPTHRFQAPYRLVDDAMRDGAIDPSLPSIKEKATELLSKEYKDRREALLSIRNGIHQYYKGKDPEFYRTNISKINRAAATLTQSYAKNMFPEMKVRWDTHPDNIGHLVSNGCFRCHDGQHKSAEGKVITHECNACHSIIEQGPAGSVEKNMGGLPFRHPTDIGNDWKENNCTDCHSGT